MSVSGSPGMGTVRIVQPPMPAMTASVFSVSSTPHAETIASGLSKAWSRKCPTNWLGESPQSRAAWSTRAAPPASHESMVSGWKISGWNASKPARARSGREPAMSIALKRSENLEMK